MPIIREEEKLIGFGNKRNIDSGTETRLLWNIGLRDNFGKPMMRLVDVEVTGPDSFLIKQAGTDTVLRRIDYSEPIPIWERRLRMPELFEKGSLADFVTYKYSNERLPPEPLERVGRFFKSLVQRRATSLV